MLESYFLHYYGLCGDFGDGRNGKESGDYCIVMLKLKGLGKTERVPAKIAGGFRRDSKGSIPPLLVFA